jgi:hypothetical protein
MTNVRQGRRFTIGPRRFFALTIVGVAIVAGSACVAPTKVPVPGPKPTATKNCAKNPSSCGFPDGTNTGVPAGTKLTAVPGQATKGSGWHWDSRGWLVVDGKGAVLDHVSVTSGIVVIASNVTIKRSRVAVNTTGQTGNDHSSAGIKVNNGAANTTITDTEIFGSGKGKQRLEAGIQCQYDVFTCKVHKVDIWNIATGVQLNGGLVQDSFIHDFGFFDWGSSSSGADHLNGITSNADGGLTVKHSTILNQFGQTDAVSLFQDFGRQANNVIDGNLFAGGGYCIYGGDGGKGATANIKVTNNRISRKFFASGGRWGWIAHFTKGKNGNVLSGNRWDETNAAVN